VVHTAQLPGIARPERLLFAADIAGTLVFAVDGCDQRKPRPYRNHDPRLLRRPRRGNHPGHVARRASARILARLALSDDCPLRGCAGLLSASRSAGHSHPLYPGIGRGSLAIFAIAGTGKALLHKMNPLVAVLLGTITGVGGGTIRDALLNQVHTVLRFEVYASAALLGSICMIVVATKVRPPSTWA
jgi:hypothetical protein